MTRVIATLSVAVEKKAELVAAALPAIAATRAEEGCIAYDLYESVTEPGELVFVEEWDSPDRLSAHSTSDHMKAFGRVAVSCFTGKPRIEII